MNHPPPLAVNRYQDRHDYFEWSGDRYLIKVGSQVKIVEVNHSGHRIESIGTVVRSNKCFYETMHERDRIKYPNLGNRAYGKIWTKHYN